MTSYRYTAASLLAACEDQLTEFSALADLQWKLDGDLASAHIGSLGKQYLRPVARVVRDGAAKWVPIAGVFDGEQVLGRSSVLVFVPPPESLPIITRLHELGWTRGGRWSLAGPWWDIYAYRRHGDLEVRLGGCTTVKPAAHDNAALPYFAPPPPRLSRRKAFKAEYDAWLGRCHREEW